MKITKVTKIVCLLIETDEEYPSEYTRYGPYNWTVRMGESDEVLHDCEEIETIYQEWLAKFDGDDINKHNEGRIEKDA